MSKKKNQHYHYKVSESIDWAYMSGSMSIERSLKTSDCYDVWWRNNNTIIMTNYRREYMLVYIHGN